jgi:Na+/phosphate symporter
MGILQIFTLLGALGMFLYGMNLMSSGLQKAAGDKLREAEIEALEDNDKNYQTSVYYIDIINELEHMGDYMINISQSLERAFVGK